MQAREPFGQKPARKAETSELQYFAKNIRMRNSDKVINNSLLSFLLGDFSRLQAIPRVRLSRMSLPEDGCYEDEKKNDDYDVLCLR